MTLTSTQQLIRTDSSTGSLKKKTLSKIRDLKKIFLAKLNIKFNLAQKQMQDIRWGFTVIPLFFESQLRGNASAVSFCVTEDGSSRQGLRVGAWGMC